ncbi:MAG: hypothetical protein ACR2QK_06455 [Acidimicrobiales bacterium]
MERGHMWCFWSAKGGVGCTVVAAGVALAMARTTPTLMIDLGGDVAAVLGRSRVDGPSADGRVGLADWLAAPNPPPDALSRIEFDVAPGLALLSWDSGRQAIADPEPPVGDRASVLAQLADHDDRQVIVDLGPRSDDASRRNELAGRLSSLASRSTLVTRACYLAVRAAERWPRPDDVVVVARQGRALRSADVAAAIGSPVGCELRWDPAVARAVDSGCFAARTPRSLRALANLIEVGR